MLINIIQNTIGGLISAGFSIVREGLKMFLPLRYSQQLGEELVVNGDFANGTTGWVGNPETTLSVSDNKLNIQSTNASGQYGSAFSNVNFKSGKQYIVKLTVVSCNVPSQIRVGGKTSTTNVSTNIWASGDIGIGTHSKVYIPTQDYAYLAIGGRNDVTTLVIDNVSVQEVGQFSLDETTNNNDAKLLTGNCLDFDGVDDYVDFGDLGAGNNKTLAYWFSPNSNITSSSSLQRFCGFNTLYFGISLGSSTTSITGETLTVITSGSSRVATTMNFDAGVFYRVVISWNETNNYHDIYVNGILKTDLVAGTSSLISWSSFLIGKTNNGGAFNGKVSDVQIWNTSWSATDVANDYAKPNEVVSSVPTVNLVGYWAMTEGNGGIAYDSSSLLSAEKVSNGTFELGSEEITNGDFATDSNWVAASGWTIEGGLASNSGTSGNLQQNSILTSSKSYKITITVSNYVSGIVQVSAGGTPRSNVTANGTYTFYQVSSGTIFFIISAGGANAFNGSVDNVSVKEVTDWTLAGNVSIGNSKANFTSGTDSYVFQTILTATKSYQISADYNVTSISSGYFGTNGSSANSNNVSLAGLSGVGTISATIIAGQTSLIFRSSNFNGSVTNISAKEVTPADNGAITNGATWLPAQSTIPQLGMMDWSKGSNLITYSEDFSQWSKLNGGTGSLPILTSNNSISPDGTQNADKIVFNKGNATSNSDYSLIRLDYGGSDINGTSSVYLKSDVNINIEISSDDISYKTILVTTNWNRFEVSDATSDRLSMGLRGTEPSNSSATIYAWAAQLEVGTSAGNYRKTNGTAVTNAILPPYPVNPTTDVLGNLLRQRLNSLNLTGSGYSSVANSSTLQFGTDAFTIQAWIKPFSLVANNRILTKGVTGNGQFMISVASDASVRVFAKDSSGNSLDTTNVFSTLTINSWQMITVIIDTPNDQILFYKNDGNVETKTGASWTGNFNSTQPITIGNTSSVSAGQFFDGLVSDALVYDRALLATEVEQNYKAGLSTHLSLAELNADAFQLRVVADGGVFESYACLKDQLTTLNDIL